MTSTGANAARPAAAFLALALLASAAHRPASAAGPRPLGAGQSGEPLAPLGAVSPWGAVASDAPEASRAAAGVLAAGGNAVDAAVAGALALGAAAPGSSGLGGQAWILVHTAAGEDVAFLSPLRAPRRVNHARAREARRGELMTGPLAPVAPAAVATLARAHERFGSRPWAELVAPAVAIAEAGYRVNEVESLFLAQYRDRIEASPALAPLYLTGECDAEGFAVPVPVGHRVVYPDLARTLRRLAEAGPLDFYRGGIAAEIAADLERHGGFLRADDLARVPGTVLETSPLRGTYRGLDVLSLPAPGAGSLVIRALHVLQAFPSGLLGEQPWARTQAVVEAVRAAYSDPRGIGPGQEVAEGPDRTPGLDPAWGEERAARIRLGRVSREEPLTARGRAPAFTDRDTTHLSVVDRDGNAVSLTQSLGRTWGSTWVTPGLGFPYNSFLEGFDVENPGSPWFLRPNATTRTAVAPTIFLSEGRPVLVVGAAGSARITTAVVGVAVNALDARLGAAGAVAAPRVSWTAGPEAESVSLEVAPPLVPSDVDLLRAAGWADLEAYPPGPETSRFGGANAVGWDAARETWEAGAEPRREGGAATPERAPAPRRRAAGR